MTPLHVAVERGDRINIMKYLIKKGADINIKDNHEVNSCVTVIIDTKQGAVSIICCLVNHRDTNNLDCIILPSNHYLLMFHTLKWISIA